MRISDWSSDVCSSDLEHGVDDRIDDDVAVGILMRWEHRGRQRLLDVEQRAEIHEDRRPKPEFLRARAARDLEFGMAQIISLAPQRVVVNPILVGDARLVRSEEHKTELQSLMRILYAVFCLKKK